MEVNVKELLASQKKEEWSNRFIKRLSTQLGTNKDIIEVEMKSWKSKKKIFYVLKGNLEDIVKYGDCLLINNIGKPVTVCKYVNILIYLADFCKKPFKEVKREDLEQFLKQYLDKSVYYNQNIKMTIKPFFRWLYNYEDEYPEVVKWIKNGKNNNRKLPEILTMEEIAKMLEVCDNMRDRALISILYESGCRASELLDLRINNINFDEYGAVIVVSGKTGDRRIRLISSIIDLRAWLNVHPRKDDGKASLFCSIAKNNKGNPMVCSSLCFVIKQIRERAKISKRIYPHLFRHTRATHLAKHLTEQELKIYFGWAKGSDMPAIYVHLSGKDVEDKILRLGGIIPEEKANAPNIPNIKCYRCGEINSIGNKFCWKCSAPLTEEKIKETEMTLRFLGSILPQILENVKSREVNQNELDDMAEIIRNLYKTKKE